MTIKNKFDIGQEVYVITDREQSKGFVTSIIVRPNNLLLYQVSSGKEDSDHYDFELTDSKEIQL